MRKRTIAVGLAGVVAASAFAGAASAADPAVRVTWWEDGSVTVTHGKDVRSFCIAQELCDDKYADAIARVDSLQDTLDSIAHLIDGSVA